MKAFTSRGNIQIETICLSEKQEGGRATADDTKMNLDEREKQQNSSGGRKAHERQPAESHHFKSIQVFQVVFHVHSKKNAEKTPQKIKKKQSRERSCLSALAQPSRKTFQVHGLMRSLRTCAVISGPFKVSQLGSFKISTRRF